MRMATKALVICTAATCVGTLQEASAATIAEFTFTGSSRASSDAETNSTVTDITDGAGITTSLISTTRGEPSAPSLETNYGVVNTAGDNLADALANNNYFTFTITPTGGASIDFTSLTGKIEKYNPSDAPGRGPTVYVFAGDFSGGAPLAGDLLGSTVVPDAKSSNGIWYDINVDLSSLSGVTTATEVRLYLDNGGASNSNHKIHLDSLVVTGEVVPEPGSLALIGLGALCVLRRRRA